MNRVVLVSNRVTDPSAAARAGGVAVAIHDILRTRGGLWFGWNGKLSDAQDMRAPEVTRSGRKGTNITVPLSTADYAGYYLGYSNSVLWPVFHNRLDLAQFEAGFYRSYIGVNKAMAAALKPYLKPDDVIWIHDYHFIPFAIALRELGVENVIGFFLHIPIPPSQTFLAIPEHQELARAFSAYDLVGLQTYADVANLIDFLSHGVAGRILQDGRIRVFDRELSIAKFAIGIDTSDFSHIPGGDPASTLSPGVDRLIGVDRLDYTKGLPQKFRAFGHFLEKYPETHQKVVLAQIAPPTRESVEAYEDIRSELQSVSGFINGRFGDLDWVPIQYIHRPTPRKKLPAIYRSSRVALVTPLRDGMNLVAKEYIAAQRPDDPGVLVLSRFAGAAEDLKEALIVNPYNVEELADAIKQALDMDLVERQERQAALLAAVNRNNVTNWYQSFLAALEKVRASNPPPLGEASIEQWAPLLQKLHRLPLSQPIADAQAKKLRQSRRLRS